MTTDLIVLTGLLIAFLAFFWLSPWGIPGLKKQGGGEDSPDLRFSYTADEAYRLFERYGGAGIAHFRRMLCVDMVFPAVYGALFWRAGTLAAEGGGVGGVLAAAAVYAPIAAALCDYGENFALLYVLGRWPERRDGAVRLASAFTSGKFLAGIATAIALLSIVLARALR